MNKPQYRPARFKLPLCGLGLAAILAAWAAASLAQVVVPGVPAEPAARALPSDTPGPVGGVPTHLPALQLPSVEQLRLVVPRQVQAATAALGFGRQRLAFVLSIGTVGSHQVLHSASRDGLAVASALRSAGFVVMVREDATSSELRAALKEFRERLQPGGMGLLYATALGAQVNGRNLLLPRETTVDAAASGAAVGEVLRSQGVPVQELVDALTGTPESTRMLVLDAAYKHPVLDKLPQSGLLAQPLPPGMMALFAQSPLVVQAVPAVAPLPQPTPSDPQLLAASTFARLLVRAVLTPKLSGVEVLRNTQRALVDSTQGAVMPWLAGDTDAREELAELTLLDAVLPRTPEEFAREGVKRAASQMVKPAGLQAGVQAGAPAGAQPVAELLQQTQVPASVNPSSPGTASTPNAPAENTRASLPEVPGNTTALGSTVNALGAAAGVAGTVASVAGTVATVAIGVKAAQAVAAATVASTVASTAVGAATSVAGNVVALATRLGSSGSGESTVRLVASVAAAVPAAPAAPIFASQPLPLTASTTTSTATSSTPSTLAAPVAARGLTAKAGEMSVADVLQASAAVPAPASVATKPPASRTRINEATDGASGPLSQSTDGRTTRNPAGGERPVYQPRRNSHGYAEGDTFSYQVTDTWKGEITGRYTTAIEEVLDNGQLLANGQQVALDAQGRLKSLRGVDGSLQRFEPHQDLWWSKPTPGQSRDVDFKEIFERADKSRGETQFKGSSTVGRLQKIDTPAGPFDALPIETSGWYHETLANGTRTSGKFERTVWYSPQLQHPVAIDIKDVDRLGKLLKRERVELTHAQQVRSAP